MSKQFNTIFAFTVVLLFFFGLFLLHSLTAYAQPTPTINYQGKLTDNTGVAVADGTYNMRFWLLQSTGQATTSAVWTESLTGANQVQVTNGLFSVMLGSTSALTSVDFNQPLYLGVEIGGTGAPSWDGEMLPRKPLGTVPAAFESFQLGGVASSSFLRSDAADTMAATEASTLLTINQSGTGDILNLLDGGAEVFTILDGGNVGIGTDSPDGLLELSAEGSAFSDHRTVYSSTETWHNAYSQFRRARGTELTPSAVASGDGLGDIEWRGYTSGSGFTNVSAGISAQVDGTPSANYAPGRLLFYTIDSAGTYNEALRITSAGSLLIGTTSTTTSEKLGVWGDLWVGSKSTPDFFVNTTDTFIGIGTSTQQFTELLNIAGDVSITGALNDNTNSPGSDGFVLQSTGSGFNWVATSSLGFASSSNLMFTGSSTFAVERTVQSKLRDIVSFLDYGAAGDGTTDDRAALVAADADDVGVLFLPKTDGNYRLSTTYNPTTPIVSLGGQFVPDSGNFFARSLLDLGSNPYIYGQRNFAAGDYTDTPVEDYTIMATSSQLYLYWINQDGYQEPDTDGNLSGAFTPGKIPGGQSRMARTGAQQVYLRGSHSGMGDAYNLYTTMSATQHASTSDVTWWSGQNATGFLSAQNLALTDKVTLYGLGDLVLNDNGNDDVAMFGQTLFLDHDGGNTGDYGIPRLGQLIISRGASSADAGSAIRGNFDIGIDLSGGTFATSTALALAANQRISWDATPVSPSSDGKFTTRNVGDTYTYFTGTGLIDVVGSTTILQRYNDNVLITSGTADLETLRVGGASSTKYTAIGQSGTVSYLSAVSTASDNTQISFRTANAGTEGDRMFISANGNVGIGDTSPSTRLDVQGTNGSAGIRLQASSGSGSSQLFIDADGDGAFTALDSGGTTDLYLTSNGASYFNGGNLGVGTTSPGRTLTVDGDARITGILYDNANSAGVDGMVLQSTGTGFQWVATSSLGITGGGSSLFTDAGNYTYLTSVTDEFTIGSSTANNAKLSIQTEGAIDILNLFNTAGQEVFTVLENGNVGIGDATPTTRLDVQGTNGSAGVRLQASTGSGASQLFIDADGDGAFTALDSGGTTDLYLTSNGASYFNGGNLGIGTSSPASKLDVWGDFRVGTSSTPNFFVRTDNGRIGIGTDTPGRLLDIVSKAPVIAMTDTDTNAVVRLSSDTANGSFQFEIDDTGAVAGSDMNIQIDGITYFTFEEGGQLGIGDTTPDQMLEISTSSNPQILLKEGAVDFLRLGVGETASTSIIGYSAVNDLLFGVYSSGSDTTLNSEYARFSSIGDFMVDGTTNATLYVDASSNRVGIGSSTPTYDLSVAGLLYGDSLLTEGANGVTNYIGRADGISGGTPTNLNNQDLLITGGNNNNFAIASQGNTGNEGLLFGNYNGTTFTEYMRLDAVSGGYLGLGTTSPRALLTVGSSTSVALQAGELYNSAYIAGSLEIDGILYDSVNNSAGTSGMVLQTTGSGFQWVATSSLGISGGITGTEGYAITFDSAGDQVATSSLFFASNGEIGIGTTTPTEKLTIYDPAAVKIDLTSLNGKPGLFFTRLNNRTVPSVGTVLGEIEAFSWAGSVTKGASIEFVTDAAWGGGDAPTAILFQTAPDGSNVVSERMRITNAGDVGIGTTSPASKLDVWGDFRVGTSGTPTLFTDVSAELIGIQTATPVADVHIGSDNTSPQMYIAGPGSGSNPLTTARPTTDDSQLILGRYTNASGGGIEFITSPAANGWGWKLNAPDQGGRQDFRIQNRNNSAAWSEVFTIKSSTGNVGIGTTSPIAKLAIDNSASSLSGTGVAGLDQYLLTENSVASAVQFGNRSWLRASNTATTTIVGNIIRVEDVTTFGNTVRGLEVQTNRGANTNGENTALSGFGRTFGVRGVTNANAGGTFEPAGGFFETEGTTQGNAIRGYSSSITTASLLSLFQDTSNFQGTGLQMNFGNTTGDFSSTSSKYLDFQNAGTSVFTVSAFGTTTIGDGTTNNMAGLQIGYGGICVDNDGSCTASTTGRITSVESQTGNSDLAEMYFSSQDLEPGEVVTLYDELSIRRATADSDMPVLGVVSTKPGLTLGFDDESTRAGERGYPLALAGRVPIKLSTENGPIKAGDSLMLSSLPGIAMKADGTGTIVGIALEDFNDTRMYSDTYINQFGDDIAEPDFTPITVNDDPRINDGCYYGGGGAAGEAPCIPLQTETVDQQIAEANELAEAEAIEDALRDLRYVSSETRALADGTVVSVGQIVMFVDRAQQLLAPDQLALFDVLMGTSSLSNQADKDEPESVFDRMVALADRFVAGVLSVFELRAERVETSELCVDGVCITADDLRALLEADKAPTPVSDPTPAPTPVADDSNDGDVVDTSDVNETSQDTSTSTEETASSTTSTSSEPVAESPEPVPPTQATQETTEPTDDATTPEVEVTEPVVNEIVIAEPAEQETSSEGEETVENTSDNGTGGQ